MKLPTGDDHGPNGPLGGTEFNRDSLPGTGGADLMFGAYHAGQVMAARNLSYFVQARYQLALSMQGGYRPGNELNSVVGPTYDPGPSGPFTQIAPTLQFLDSSRAHDSGLTADPPNSGYERLLIAAGVRLKLSRKTNVYTDIEILL